MTTAQELLEWLKAKRQVQEDTIAMYGKSPELIRSTHQLDRFIAFVENAIDKENNE